jgi:uncharacterized protein (TIRG00374 family)
LENALATGEGEEKKRGRMDVNSVESGRGLNLSETVRLERQTKDEAAGPKKRAIPLWLRIVVSAGLLAVLLGQADLDNISRVMTGARLEWLLVLMLMFPAERCLGAYRWHLLVRIQEPMVSLGTTVKAHLVAGFIGTFLPGTVGMEAARVVAMQRATSNLAMATATVLLDRMIGLVALLGMVLVAVKFAAEPIPVAVPAMAGAALVLIIVALVGCLHPGVLDATKRWLPLSENLRERFGKFARSLLSLRARPGVLVQVGALSVVFQVLRVGTAPVAALALGLQIPLALFAVYVPIILLLMMMPVSLSGHGVREAGFVGFFGRHHMSPEAALAIGLLTGAFSLLIQLPGAFFCITGVRSVKKEGREEGSG